MPALTLIPSVTPTDAVHDLHGRLVGQVRNRTKRWVFECGGWLRSEFTGFTAQRATGRMPFDDHVEARTVRDTMLVR